MHSIFDRNQRHIPLPQKKHGTTPPPRAYSSTDDLAEKRSRSVEQGVQMSNRAHTQRHTSQESP
jgi:hypothetical protein